MDSSRQAPEDIRRLSDLMDSRFRGPGGFRFGWDGILGFIPFFGDFLTNGASLYIIVRAAAIGCPPSVLLRMGLNLLVDNMLDLIPVLGNFFDFFWRANNKNITLLERYLSDPRRTVRSSRVVVWLTVLFLLAMMVLFFVGAYYLAVWIFSLLPHSFTDMFSQGEWDA